MFELRPTEPCQDGHWINEVMYGPDAKALLREPLQRWLTAVKSDSNAAQNQNDWMTALALVIMWYSMRIKHEAYEQEHEVRLVTQNGGTPSLTSLIDFRVRGASVVPFVPIPIDVQSASIEEVVIGPAADDGALDALHALAEKGYLKEVYFRKSDIPYKAL